MQDDEIEYKDNKNKLWNFDTKTKNSDVKKKTIEELRQERINREIQEKEKINKFLKQNK